jgi:site-specific recombinase XerD
MTFEQAKMSFVNYERMIGSQPKTINHYSSVIDSFLKVCECTDPANLSMQHIYLFANYMTVKGLSVATRANYLRHIKAFYHFLCRSAIITEKTLWQEIRLPKSSKKVVQIYDEIEIADIYDASEVISRRLTARNRCMVSFMLDCGLRQEEVTKLTLQDVSGNMVIVHGKGRKDRIVPKGKQLQSDLDKWLQFRPQSDFESLFLTRTAQPLTTNTIKMLFQRITETVGYPVSSHRLRHNFATNYLLDSYDKNGWFDCYSLMVLLGHEDIRTTERYLHYCQQVVACRNAHSHLDKIYGLA